MGYDQYTVSGSTVAVELTFVAFLYHLQTLVHGLSCHSLKFFGRTVNLKPPTIPLGIVASDNLSRTVYTPNCVLTDTSVKETPRVGPCLSLIPLFDSV